LNDGQVQNPGAQKLDSGTIPNGLEGFWIRPSFKDRFLSRRAKPQSHDSQLFASPYVAENTRRSGDGAGARRAGVGAAAGSGDGGDVVISMGTMATTAGPGDDAIGDAGSRPASTPRQGRG
jgi:hypothetical protein